MGALFGIAPSTAGNWHWLIPEMPPGSIVVLDNLLAHKVAGVRQCLEAAGMGVLYLPPYSPDLNPIELVFLKIKRALRRFAPRSFDAMCDALNVILETFSTKECANDLQGASYVQS